MKKLFLLLLLIPNLVMGEQILLSCNGSGLSRFCSSDSGCAKDVSSNNLTFDVVVTILGDYLQSILITPNHTEIWPIHINNNKEVFSANNKTTWQLRTLKPEILEEGHSLSHGAKINRVTGNILAFVILESPKGGVKNIDIQGACSKVTRQKF